MTVSLPKRWAWATVDDVANLIRGVTFKKVDALDRAEPGFVPIARAGNLEPGQTRLTDDLIYVSRNSVTKEQYLRAGDVLIAMSSGSLSVVGKSAIVAENWVGAHGAFMAVIRAYPEMNSTYLGYFLQSREVRKRWRELAAGTNINNLKKNDLLSTAVPIAPSNEQERIARRIEELFSRLDRVDSKLESVLNKLNLHRSAILADAFHTGRDMPPGWKQTALREVCLPVHKVDPRKSPSVEFAYIDIGGVGMGTGKIVETRTLLGVDAPTRARQVVRSGDTLLSTVRTYQKKTAVVPAELDRAIASTGFSVLRPSDGVHPYFLFFQVFGDAFVGSLNKRQTGTSYPAVRDKDVKSLQFRLAPFTEQEEIARDIEDSFNRIDITKELIENLVNRVALLRRSILTEAFAGRLVPQDPDDEPASVLLGRLAAFRSAKPKRRRKTRA